MCLFSKRDLKDGMVVEYANEERRLVLGDSLIGIKSIGSLAGYNENLILGKGNFPHMNINRVYKIKGKCKLGAIFNDKNLELIWERTKDIKKMTVEEMLVMLEGFLHEEIEVV